MVTCTTVQHSVYFIRTESTFPNSLRSMKNAVRHIVFFVVLVSNEIPRDKCIKYDRCRHNQNARFSGLIVLSPTITLGIFFTMRNIPSIPPSFPSYLLLFHPSLLPSLPSLSISPPFLPFFPFLFLQYTVHNGELSFALTSLPSPSFSPSSLPFFLPISLPPVYSAQRRTLLCSHICRWGGAGIVHSERKKYRAGFGRVGRSAFTARQNILQNIPRWVGECSADVVPLFCLTNDTLKVDLNISSTRSEVSGVLIHLFCYFIFWILWISAQLCTTQYIS